MDTTKQFTAIEWCAGYGGIHLGLKRAIPNLRVIAYGEIEAFAVANLVAKMEAGLMDCAPIWSDLKTFPCEDFRDRVDILVAGYPCQPFSAAGKRAGKEDPRHLWPWIADGIRLLRPRMCFFENVEGHLSLGLREVIGELEQIGYTAAWGIFSASEVGAPHQRKRVFILAHLKCDGLEGLDKWHAPPEQTEFVGADSGSSGQCSAREGCGELVDAGRIEPQGWGSASQGQQSGAGRIPRSQSAPCDDQVWPSRPGEPQHGWEPPRVVGNSNRPHARHGEQRPERELGDLSGGCGEGRGELGDSTHQRDFHETEQDLSEAWTLLDRTSKGAGEVVGDTHSPRPQERQGQRGAGIQGIDSNGGEDADRQIEPALGRDPHGPAGGLDYAELQVTCDNRTDELRLLGNGVVPATAERAFRVLMEEIFKQPKNK